MADAKGHINELQAVFEFEISRMSDVPVSDSVRLPKDFQIPDLAQVLFVLFFLDPLPLSPTENSKCPIRLVGGKRRPSSTL